MHEIFLVFKRVFILINEIFLPRVSLIFVVWIISGVSYITIVYTSIVNVVVVVF